jgi:hypothetical protein
MSDTHRKYCSALLKILHNVNKKRVLAEDSFANLFGTLADADEPKIEIDKKTYNEVRDNLKQLKMCYNDALSYLEEISETLSIEEESDETPPNSSENEEEDAQPQSEEDDDC